MSDWQSQNQPPGASSAPDDPTAVMPGMGQPVQQPPGPPAGMPPGSPPRAMPPKKGMPGWVWAIIGAVVMLVLIAGGFGLFVAGRTAGQKAAETTSTASVVASSTAATSGVDVSAEVTETSTPSGSAASEDSANSGSSGGSDSSGSSGDSDSSGSSSGSSSSDSSGDSDSSGSSSGSDSSSSSEPVYRSVLKLNGNTDYTSSPIRLESGHMKISVWVTRTNHHPLVVRYRRGTSSFSTWWATPNAVAGQTRTSEIDVTSAGTYQFRVLQDPGAAWTLRVMWKP